MEFHSFTASAMCVLCLLHMTVAVYQPECDTLDTAVQQIESAQEGFAALGLSDASINCTRNPACDGFGCVVNLEGKSTELRIKLHPCEDPPQMFLLVQDHNTNMPYIEETVTHGDTYPIPGLNYEYLQFLQLNVALRVQFEKVTDGFRIGLYLKFTSFGVQQFEVPFLNPIVIQTPPCTTQEPGQDIQCVRMHELVSRLSPPLGFQCDVIEECRGFNCSGDIPALRTSLRADSVLDSCTNPISYTITLRNRDTGEALWSHSFTRSESVFIEGPHVNLPPGVTANLNVTIVPYTMDIDYFITSIRLTFCAPFGCQAETFIDNERVPIPPCEHPLSTSSRGPTTTSAPLTGAGDECSTWHAIATDVMNSNLFSEDQMRCHVNGDCDGFICDLYTRGHNFVISVRLFHCENPVRLLFRMDDVDEGFDFHVASNVTRNEIVALDGFIEDGKMKFLLVQRSSSQIELALSVELPEPGGQIGVFPLVSDRFIPVAPCPPPTHATLSTTETRPKTKPPPTPTPTKPGSKSTAKPTKGGKKRQSDQPQSYALPIGVGVSVAALVVVVILILAYVWYRRSSHRPSDHLTLMEDSSAPI